MQVEIFEAGAPVGTLELTRQGLYQAAEAVCRPRRAGVNRLYLWKGRTPYCLGVPLPEGDGFTLRRRLSAASLPFAPETAVLGREEDGWLPWRGSFAGETVESGWLKPSPEGMLLAVADGSPCAETLAGRVREEEALTLGGTPCRSFSETPLPPEPDAQPEPAPTPAPDAPPETAPTPEPDAQPETASTSAKEEPPVENDPPLSHGQLPPPPHADEGPAVPQEIPVRAAPPAKAPQAAGPLLRFHTEMDAEH